MLQRTVSRPRSLLLLVVALFTLLIQSGELGTSDTTHRLQVTHSLWTEEPQVFPAEYPEFGLHGRGGRLYASYGIGQSLLMLPADLLGSAAARLPLWRDYGKSEADPAIRSIVVSVSTNVLLNVVTAWMACSLLELLGFSIREAVAGTLGLLCATTHLHYAQNMTENNFIFLLTLTGLTLQLRWLKTGDRRQLLLGSLALGANLLTRITTALDIGAVGCFLVLIAWFAREEVVVRPRVGEYLRTALPVYGFFLLVDRLYQFVRFDSWTTTYVGILAREQRRLDPRLPANFPFDGHWLQGGINSGLLGPLFAPEKSIFLFDPVFPVMLLLTVLLWRRLNAETRAFVLSTLLLTAGYILFYGKYDSWGGDYAWGDRYVSSAVELASLIAVPLLMRHWDDLRTAGPVRVFAVGAIGVSVLLQAASLAFWLPLELYQGETFGRHVFTVGLRLENIAAFILNRQQAWGLRTPAIFEDPWDAQHLTTWNFLPSLLRHVGVAPLWTVHVLYGVWVCVAFALLAASLRLYRVLTRSMD